MQSTLHRSSEWHRDNRRRRSRGSGGVSFVLSRDRCTAVRCRQEESLKGWTLASVAHQLHTCPIKPAVFDTEEFADDETHAADARASITGNTCHSSHGPEHITVQDYPAQP